MLLTHWKVNLVFVVSFTVQLCQMVFLFVFFWGGGVFTDNLSIVLVLDVHQLTSHQQNAFTKYNGLVMAKEVEIT